MSSGIYTRILNKANAKQKMLAVLIDPDKCNEKYLLQFVGLLKSYKPDFIFVGGSQPRVSFTGLVDRFKFELGIPVLLFPGDITQFTPSADALLFLSLISGRNAEYLISQHIKASIPVYKSGIEVIPTGYILVDGGRKSAVEYISNTQPLPRDNHEIVLSTALAGQLLGMKAIYLEAGSGAQMPVPPRLIEIIKSSLHIPLIVGGGIKTAQQLKQAYNAGADLVVIGNILENNPEMIREFVSIQHMYKKEISNMT